jgi:hypothetical protein
LSARALRNRIAVVKLGANSKIDLIKGVPLFSGASKAQLAEIAAIADEVDLPAGRTLIKEGDSGREFFILIDGTADVTQGGKQIGRMMGPGDFFGEIALISKAPRTATVTTYDRGARTRGHGPRVPAAARALAGDRGRRADRPGRAPRSDLDLSAPTLRR